jgi:hypothetical protein
MRDPLDHKRPYRSWFRRHWDGLLIAFLLVSGIAMGCIAAVLNGH